jgi:hypothetical protein
LAGRLSVADRQLRVVGLLEAGATITFSTWLEDAGIPARVIDELMGHERSRRGELDGGSRIGARYRHTTPEMAVRVAAAIQQRLAVVVQVAEAILQLDESGGRVF